MRFSYVLLGLLTITSLHVSKGSCSMGVAGVQSSDICCEAQCGTCGGEGCGQLPGGVDGCCPTSIRDNGDMCSTTFQAPCILDYLCSNGVAGVQSSDVCCEAECGTCGGSGCSQRPGGVEACCTARIRDKGLVCSTTLEAPCIVDDTPEALCDNGVPGVQAGNACCEAKCGTCGGEGCSQREGGVNACCANTIRANGEMCSTTMEAPCIVDA